jgi:hypothetical protein
MKYGLKIIFILRRWFIYFLYIWKEKSDAIIEKKEKYFRALENNQGIITVIDEEFKVV